jgi:biotin operon repressor
MIIKKENLNVFLASLKIAASNLKGSTRRMFLGQLALDYGKGGRLAISENLGISRVTLNKGIEEVKTGIIYEDKFEQRGRKKLEELNPKLLEDIKEIGDASSQTDPQFKSTRLYTRLSVNQVRKALIKRGYKDDELPSNETLRNKLISLGFKRRKVAKTKPKKK